ncbi:hypothetical protein EST38_g5464 [Candolleomyces aberdarensis]|uniref:Uncharacterized protein n=1 Tax=Candolleomyces aberdarensis TaxID=2316362 RepID=A0A4Q2DN52_9AGAR|nr:hypothetical protein EST38_g5464 [Candolleomyces aberdarensis]
MPKPYLLPRDIASYSSINLEHIIRQSSYPWNSSSLNSRKRVPVKDPFNDFNQSFLFVPGGRWVLWSQQSGCVWYQDPDFPLDALSEGVLIASPFDEVDTSQHLVNVMSTLAIDVSSELVEQGSANLKEFNLTVISNQLRTAIVIRVWKVKVDDSTATQQGFPPPTLVATEMLASFNEDPIGVFGTCSLFGTSIAYSVASFLRLIVIVTWDSKDVTERSNNLLYPRRYIETHRGVILYHLPGGRLFVVKDYTAACF